MKTNRFSLVLESLTELASEIDAAHADPRPALPLLSEVLTELGPLPANALFLGLADDGLPVLLDLRDSVPGPLLVAGDAQVGKTAFLQTVALAAARVHDPNNVQFGIVTDTPQEWESLGSLPHLLGVYNTQDNEAADFITSLHHWAHENRQTSQYILLLIDELADIGGENFKASQALRWLFLRGPSRRVWPIVTLTGDRAGQVLPWLDFFRTRIFGKMQPSNSREHLVREDTRDLDSLLANAQFALREGRGWLRFWIPQMD
ncbi:MAG: FtsK/SpoIIIE domain-containing protein [Chloroflexota bacterium]